MRDKLRDMRTKCRTCLVAAIVVSTFHCNVTLCSDTEEIKVIVERNVPVPMRDGTILWADVHRPDHGGPYPVLVQRTPYGKGGNFDQFVKAGYIVVSQDARGRYESEGEWESVYRLVTHDAEDGYDTVEWAAKLPGSNGKVGTWGISYDAFLQWRLAPLQPPSLMAMSPCGISASNPNQEIGAVPGEFLRWWVTSMTPDMRRRKNRPGVHSCWEATRLWNEGESQKWTHWLPWLELPREVFEDEEDHFKYLLKNPHIDPWRLDKGIKDVLVPILELAGWYDPGKGDMELYAGIVKEGKTEIARRGSQIIIGPWTHGTYARKYGNIDFGPNAALDRIAVQVRWFDYWLKGKFNGVDKDPPVRIFVMGDNKWRNEKYWPLRRTKEKVLYIASGGNANTPSGDGKLIDKRLQQPGEDEYRYDPNNPVQSLRGGPDLSEVNPADRRPLADREDILVYKSEALTERIEVTGNPVVELYAASSAPDTDWYVWLIDVSPDGLAREVSVGKIRVRYRDGLDRPKFVQPEGVIRYMIRMRPTSNAFLPGHRIRLDITSSDFPNYDRNHNTAADQNADVTLVAANQTIYHGGEYSTRVILPWVPNPTEEEKSVGEEKSEGETEKQTYPFHQAAADDDIEQIRMLISKGVDINTQDAMKRTPLHCAVKAGKMKVVQLLVKSGADVNIEGSNDNRSPLYMAVQEDNIAIAEYLIAHGADVNAGRPLEDAPYYSSVEMVELLITKGADINAGPWTSLHSAVEEGREDIAALLIQKGADINAKEDYGRTPLDIAVAVNRLEMIELLITKGADINAKDNRGVTALHAAVLRKRRDIATLLIQKGADINAKDNSGRTPLYRVVEEGSNDIAALLIQKGADINAKDNNGVTSLSLAISANNKDIIELLLAKIRDLELKDERGLTALHNAAVEGYPDIAKLLLAKGAKVDERDDNYEFTALHYAARFGNKDVAEVLIANGADIKAKDKWDYQPIHWAAYHDRPDIIELLIAKGADVNAKTSLGQTPLDLAIPRRNTGAIEVLLKHGSKE